MQEAENISVELRPEVAAQVRKAVESGEYNSSNEVIEDALRDWSHGREVAVNDIDGLARAWDAARHGNVPGKPAEEVLDRLERKYRTMTDRASSR
jgi:antitoxin ParD1/3/4